MSIQTLDYLGMPLRDHQGNLQGIITHQYSEEGKVFGTVDDEWEVEITWSKLVWWNPAISEIYLQLPFSY